MSNNENIMSSNSALSGLTLKGKTVNGSTAAALSLNENTHIHNINIFKLHINDPTFYILTHNILNFLDPVPSFSSRCPTTPKRGSGPYSIGLRRKRDPSCHHQFILSLSMTTLSFFGELSSTRTTRR